jgi:hypothetical protein
LSQRPDLLPRALAFLAIAAGAACVSCAQGGAGGLEAPDPSQRPVRVVLISVAGLRPEHYGVARAGSAEEEIDVRAAVMPQLAALARSGAHAEAVEPVMPSSPYPIHATLATGLRPLRHGLLGDELLGPEGLHLRGLSSENRIRGTTLWRAARAAGRAVAALGWPSTLGADVDLLLPDLGVPSREEKASWLGSLDREATPWIVDRLRRMDESLVGLPWPSPAMEDELVARLACDIAAQPVAPALWLLAFEQSGVALARGGPNGEEARAAFGEIDAAIEYVLGCFRDAGLLEGTAFLVVGDRSFLPLHTLVYPNVILEQVGLITLAPVLRGSGIARWDAFVRSSGGAGLVYAMSESSALMARKALEEEMQRSHAYRIVPASELQALHADPQAWFGVEGLSGYGIGKSFRGQLLQSTQRQGLGGYLPSHPESAVGFVAFGAGIRPGARIDRMSQIDVAPTAASLLGLELPGADGSPLAGILVP